MKIAMLKVELFRIKFFLLLFVTSFVMSQEVILQDQFSKEFDKMTRRRKMRHHLYSIPQEKYLIDLIGHIYRNIAMVDPNYGSSRTNDSGTFDDERTAQFIRASLSDIVNEWETAKVIEFQLREQRLVGYQKEMLTLMSQESKSVMAKDLFRLALERFNEADYKSAIMLMENLLSTYSFVQRKDRVNYFLGFSYYYIDRYNEAIRVFEKVIASSKFDRPVVVALAKMYIDKNDFVAVTKIEKKFSSVSSKKNSSDLLYFIVGRYYISIQKFANAIRALKKVSSNYRLYHDSRFFYATALYKSNKEASKRVFLELADGSSATGDIRNESYLRLAYIDYQEGKYSDALLKLDKINSDDVYAYDRILLARAWCYYEIGSHDSKNRTKNFSTTISLLNTVVNDYLDSEYYNEAKSLLGYVKQRLGSTMGAENDFFYVFKSKSFKIYSDRFLMERDSLLKVKTKVKDLEEVSCLENDPSSFGRLGDIKFNIDRKLHRLKYMDFSSIYPNVAVDLNVVYKQINEFERLRKIVKEKKDVELVKRIDGNLLRLYSTVNKYRRSRARSLFGVNYFKDYRLARKVSMVGYGDNKFYSLANKSMKNYTETLSKIAELEKQKKEAIGNDNPERVVSIDIALYRLKRNSNNTDNLNSVSSAHIKTTLADNLDKWANYGAYQLTNIQYIQKQKIAKENRENEFTVKKISALMGYRNTYLAEQIKRIENNIYTMVRREAKKRRIAERERTKEFFKIEFFDETKSEVNEDSIRNELERKAYERRILRNKVNNVFGLSPDTLLNVDSLLLESSARFNSVDTLLNNTDTIQNVEQNGDKEAETGNVPSGKNTDDSKSKDPLRKEE